MSLSLYVDGQRWREHMRAVQRTHPGLVPVAKGNGYGLGMGRLARRAGWLGADTLAVGTYEEVPEVRRRFDGSILVLTPWRPHVGADTLADDRLVHTVSRPTDLAALCERPGRPRVVLERMTSMRRHGLSAHQLRQAAGPAVAHEVRLEGVALHLPLGPGSHRPEAERLLAEVVDAGLPTRRVFVSHLSDTELAPMRSAHPGLELRPRVGTALWLGDRAALVARATVLDAHPVERGDVFGYRGRRSPGRGTILVVSGGTAHGIGLAAPTPGASLRRRARALARGGLDAVGLVRSPFTVDGRQRLFAEPPHMQASMLFLPQDAAVPPVGDEVDLRVRFTTTTFDRVLVG